MTAPDYADRIAARYVVAYDANGLVVVSPDAFLSIVADAARQGYALGYSVQR